MALVRAATTVLAVVVLPTLLFWALHVDLVYTPRRVDLALFLSPWAAPTDLLDLASRLIQLAALVYFNLPLPILWALISLVALIRAPIGFLLTRSVGWAVPQLFNHYALYETMTGWGPGIVIWQAVDPVHEWSLAVVALFAWLERRPWTYTVTLGVALVIIIVRAAFPQVAERLLDKPRSADLPLRTSLYALAAGLLSLAPFALRQPARLPFPETTLDIMLLSFPRPGDSSTILQTTVDSYLPFLNDNVTLSGFTHAPDHAAFKALSTAYNFHIDDDQHPDDEWGHYLHLAEAFRWAEGLPAEWIMLTEDDFPLCPGGWDVVSTVMNKLESERRAGRISSGFVGTGGSGLILHHSYLPILQMVLREYSRSASRLPPGVHRRAPDQVIQDCLRGTPGSLCERREGKIIITSRLVMDHIGGMATTTEGKSLNSDKWRCGWRHAWHGAPDVEVVIV